MNNNDAVLISIDDLVTKIGVPKSTIYYWVQRRKIPFLRAGKHLRFDPQDVLEHFKSCTTTYRDKREIASASSLKIEETMKKRGNSKQ